MTDKSQIIRNIKNSLGFKNDTEFAKFLGIKPQTLATWYTRNTFNLELIYAKCENIDANYLLTGEGKMFRNSSENATEEKEKPTKTTQYYEEINTYLLKRVKELEEELSDLKGHHDSDDAQDVDRGSYKKTGTL